MNLKGRSFLTLLDYSPEVIEGLLDLAAELKAKKRPASPTRISPARTSR